MLRSRATSTEPAASSRPDRKASFARRLVAALEGARLHAINLASIVGVGASKAARWTSPLSGESLPASDLDALPAPVLRPLVEHWASQLRCSLVDLPAAIEGGDMQHAVWVAKQATNAAMALMEAAADGTLDPRESTTVRPLIRKAVAALLGADALLARVDVERVVVLPVRGRDGR